MNLTEQHQLKVDTKEKRNQLKEKLPALAIRIFDLRYKSYDGRSFEKSIGYLLHKLNDFESKFDYNDLLIYEVIYEDLIEQVEEAESNLKYR